MDAYNGVFFVVDLLHRVMNARIRRIPTLMASLQWAPPSSCLFVSIRGCQNPGSRRFVVLLVALSSRLIESLANIIGAIDSPHRVMNVRVRRIPTLMASLQWAPPSSCLFVSIRGCQNPGSRRFVVFLVIR